MYAGVNNTAFDLTGNRAVKDADVFLMPRPIVKSRPELNLNDIITVTTSVKKKKQLYLPVLDSVPVCLLCHRN